jgi:capsular polysaccharide biosynthesis protein
MSGPAQSGTAQPEATAPAVAHDLAYYIAPIRRRKRIVIALTLVGLILGVVAAALLHPTYTAIAQVSVNPDNTSGTSSATSSTSRTTGNPNMDTEAQIAKSKVVAQLAHDELKNDTPIGQIQSKLAVSVPANTTILRLAYTARSPKAAAAGAKAFADAYLKNRTNSENSNLNGQIQNVQGQIDHETTQQTTDLNAQHSIPESEHHSTAYAEAVQKVKNDGIQIANFKNSLSALQAITINPGNITSAPTASGLAAGPQREIAVGTGLFLGLLLGLIGGFILDYRDPTIRSATDVELTGIPVLAEVPKPGTSRRDRKGGRADRADAAARRKANQRIATGVAAALGADGGSIYLANLSPSKQAELLADELARELGRFGSTVEIAGRGEDSISTSWDPAGFSGDLAHRDHARYTDLDSSLHTRAAVAVVEQALARSRFVIIDGLGDFEGLDPYVLSSLGQVGLIVVEPGVTTRAELADAVDQMSMTSCHILGALLWHPPTKANEADLTQWRRARPRAIEASVTVETATTPDTEPRAGSTTTARPMPGTASEPQDQPVGWPQGTVWHPASTDGEDDIQDAEVVNDDEDDDATWQQSSPWNQAPRE